MGPDWMGRRVCAALLLIGLTQHRCSGPQVTVETTIDLASLVGEGRCSHGPEVRDALFQPRGEWRSVLLAQPGDPLQCSGLLLHDAGWQKP